MPRYLNTDNGQVLTVADHEASIYEAASNFVPYVDAAPEPVVVPAPGPAPVTLAKKTVPRKKLKP